jgi:hypothetical protein
VSLTNDKGNESFVTAVDIESWGPLWKAHNDVFEASIKDIPQFSFLRNRKLYVCDGNHRYKAWMGYIDRVHSQDPIWHFSVDCICIDIKGKVGLALHAMHDINKYIFIISLIVL